MFVKGIWTFKDTIDVQEDGFGGYVKFISNGDLYNVIYFSVEDSENWVIRFWNDETDQEDDVYYSDLGWGNEAYKTIEILEEPTDERFIAWLKENATQKQLTIAEKLAKIAENEPKVFEAGKKAEHTEWWESFQYDNRNKETNAYIFGFCGYGWNDTTFKPIKDIRPTGNATGLFRYAKITDIVDCLERQGVTLDTSKTTTFSNMFEQCYTKRVGVINASANGGNFSNIFASAYIERIEMFIVNDKTVSYNNAFLNASKLAYIRIGGVIPASVSFQWCPLDKGSIESIINALSSASSGLTVTLKASAVNKAFETSEGAEDGSNSAEWDALKKTKSNWTITLV